MEPRIAAQIEAEKTYSDFIAWSKTAPYCILAFSDHSRIFLTLERIKQEAKTTVNSTHRLM